MRLERVISLAVALTLVGCGSSSSDTGGSTGGGSTGGGGSTTYPTGTLGGSAFTPADGIAAVLAPTACTIGGLSANGTVVAFLFSNVPSSCSAYQAMGACNDKANAIAVSADIARRNLGGVAVGPIGPGTYPLTTGTPTPDASGTVTEAFIGYSRTSATCVDAAASVNATSGSITITTITSTRVTGSLTVTFSDGSSFGGSFDVPICAVPFDVCAMASCSGTPACVP